VPAAAPPARPKPRQAPQPASSGIVSTRLRPWLEIEFTPTRAVVDREKAAVEFELSLFNSGSADARNVLIEGWLTNASAHQDQQIRTFFDNPTAKGDRIPVIAPLQRIALKNAVFLPLTELRPLEIEGRQLFVPMVAFNALYGWSRGEGQTSTSYLVGKVGKSDKLGAFRMDQGPRLFRGLAAREHEIRVRN
ncbi:MAG TPA: hypothetical protein VFP53_08310, partial [Sphingomicrobium sp.]|nr:hypothetical protein [Sphingomicrobium sp.]